jgi:two-component system, chemotaxis family, chemotaxis protein CheY
MMTASGVDFSQLGVMIVDDNRHMRGLLCSIMHALGIKRMKELGDGESALAEIGAFEPDLLITDWHMEPMDGTTLVKTIRHSSDELIRYVPIIMLSGHSDMLRVREARDCGVHEFLTKPVSAKSLLARLITIIEQPRPFIKTEQYFGPDRRRQDIGPPSGEADRRSDAAPEAVGDAAEMSAEDALAS